MSYLISLSSKELQEVDIALKAQKESKVYKRLVSLKMKNHGLSNKEIANILSVHIDTITNWHKLYISLGLKGLCELHLKNRKKSKLDIHINEIRGLAKEKTISTIAELQDNISKLYGIEIEHSWLSRYCKKNSIFLIKRQG
jgi:transposase